MTTHRSIPIYFNARAEVFEAEVADVLLQAPSVAGLRQKINAAVTTKRAALSLPIIYVSSTWSEAREAREGTLTGIDARDRHLKGALPGPGGKKQPAKFAGETCFVHSPELLRKLSSLCKRDAERVKEEKALRQEFGSLFERFGLEGGSHLHRRLDTVEAAAFEKKLAEDHARKSKKAIALDKEIGGKS